MASPRLSGLSSFPLPQSPNLPWGTPLIASLYAISTPYLLCTRDMTLMWRHMCERGGGCAGTRETMALT